MRFLVAIGTLCVAALLLIVGLVFKFTAGANDISMTVATNSSSAYAVIDADVMKLHPGNQAVSISTPGLNTVAYGATTDVLSWLAGSSYAHVTLADNSKTPSVTEVSAAESALSDPAAAAAADKQIVSPAGSDMWLGEMTNPQGEASLQMQLSSNESIIVATDGVKALPSEIGLSWPKPKPTFLWMTDDVLIVVGGVILLAGILLYLWSLNKLRGGKGPRRRGRLPKGPKPNMRIGRGPRQVFGPAQGRRSLGKTTLVTAGVAGALALGLSGCSGYQNGLQNATPTPTASDEVTQSGPGAVVTSEQASLIMDKVVAAMKTADEQNDVNLARTRMTGAALDARAARYAMRKSNSKISALPGINAQSIQLLLPQATELWPRSVMAIAKADASSEKGQEPPSVAVILTQDSPRANYKVAYLTNLQAKQQIPQVASMTAGAPLIALDTALLAISPNVLAAKYGDVLTSGEKSASARYFDASSDQLRPALLNERKQQQGKDVKSSYKDLAGAATPVAFATIDGGALVLAQVNELGTFTPLNNKDLKLTGQLTALAGVQISAQPTVATYGMQVLFYVPPATDQGKVRLLGYVENLIGVSFNK